jgi:PAS domain S-box-containing protein
MNPNSPSRDVGTRILAVDDVEAKRYAWQRILTRAGFEVSTASSGQEALRRVLEKPDLVILDVRLPDIGGLEVCRRIKEEPSTASIPVLHISASLISPEDRAVALTGGADGYLSEPVDPEELVATVNALLRMRKAEEQARAAAAEWQTTFDAIQDGIAVVDVRGRIARCNKGFAAIVGRPNEELISENFRRVLVRDLKCGGQESAGFPSWSRTRESLEAPCESRWIRITVDPVLRDGSMAGAICILSDITERRKAEEEVVQRRDELRLLNASLEQRVMDRTERLQSVVKELEAFTYTIAHDLRAPLRSMHRFGEVLLEEYGPKLEAEGRDYARHIIQGAERMDILISDLLSYSRLSQSEIRPQLLRPGEIAAEAWSSLTSCSSGPELMVENPLPDVVGDRILLQQVFLNLFSNAIKFVAPEVPPRIRLSGLRQGATVTLSVVDNGIGISKDSQSRVFQVFERLASAKDYPGTGIGLAIVRRAMDRMDGACGVESDPGGGSRFWICLPAAGAMTEGRP